MILIRLVSTARTGYTYTTQKNRKYPTFSIKKYDPMSMFIPLLSTRLDLSLMASDFVVKRHVLFVEQKMK